jgi:hypothetical protein
VSKEASKIFLPGAGMNGLQVAGIIEQGDYEHSSRVLKTIDRRGILFDSPEMGVIQA